MAAFISDVREDSYNLVDLAGGRYEQLRRRRDYDAVLSYLRAAGLVDLLIADDHPVGLRLTDKGMTWFEDTYAANSERRWTRGLAIASIVISVLALAVSILPMLQAR